MMPTLNEKIDAVFVCMIMGLIGAAGGSLLTGSIFGIIGNIVGAVFFGTVATVTCVKLFQKEWRTGSSQNKQTNNNCHKD